MRAAPAHWLGRAIVMAITVYQHVADTALPCCKHFPSCSSYAQDAVRRHGAWAGLGLTVKRLARCHPFSQGGWDPVP